MEAALGEALRWANLAWPDHDWSRSELWQGAFHEVLVLPRGPAARLTTGPGHRDRVRRETEVMALLARLELPTPIPAPLSAPVTVDGRSGVLTSFVAGQTMETQDWSVVRGGLTRVLAALQQIEAVDVARLLPPPRGWCGGAGWQDVVSAQLVPLLPPHARAPANRVVADVLRAERLAEPQLVHGDFGLHNVLWTGATVSGLIDVDHASWGDPAIDVAPLIGAFGVSQLAADFEPEVLQRGMYHRATLSLQVAAAAQLADRTGLRDHALENFARRQAEGTLYDPEGHRPD